MGAWIETTSALANALGVKSLPMWERGLKLGYVPRYAEYKTSLPMWERGLKPPMSMDLRDMSRSLPMWERGLKHLIWRIAEMLGVVAPHVGAWIETRRFDHSVLMAASLPMWERGLKPQSYAEAWCEKKVAPHVGAWIETVVS